MASKVYVLVREDGVGIDRQVRGVFAEPEAAKRAYEALEPDGVSGEWQGGGPEWWRHSYYEDGRRWGAGYVDEYEVGDGE